MSLVVGVAIGLLLVAAIWWSKRRQQLSRVPLPKDKRRSYRVALSTPVFVYGWASDKPFSENTETVNVSAVGGLIKLSEKVAPSQSLIVTNLQTNEDLPCRVARSTQTEDGKTLVGLDFTEPASNFWQIDFVSGWRETKVWTVKADS